MSIGVGILGFAHGHVNGYLSQWKENELLGIDVIAGWDHNKERLEQAANNHGMKACLNMQEMLVRDDIYAVVIASETSLHAELVEAAAAAGKAIILQKPMALTLPEADRIVAAVKQHQVPFTMAWQMRVDPQNLKMKELILSGEMGKVYMVRRRHGLGLHLIPGFEETWHAQPALNRDIWADDAAHAADFIYWLLGEPETVTAEIESLDNPKIPMDNGIAIYRYPKGPIAEVFCSFTCGAAENTTEIIAEKGTIIQNYGDVPSCNVPRPDGAPGLKWYLPEKGEWTYSDIVSPTGHFQRIVGLAKPLAEFLHGQRDAIATADEGRTALRMILACYLSVQQGRRVHLTDPHIAGI